MFLHVPWMLLGLAALAIPLIIHLLNRRRFDVVEWGAMQFLKLSEATRRRLMLEELLLMLLRMGLLAVLVFAVAGPFFDTALPAKLGSRPPRDLVLIIDGSASMGAGDERGNPTPAELARERALALLDELGEKDGLAVLLARERVVPLLGELSHDRDRARQALDALPAPAGGCDWPAALRQAEAILSKSQKAERDIVMFGDNQRNGWADADTLFRWELLAGELGSGSNRPRRWFFDLAEGRSARPPNYALGPLTTTGAVVSVGREVTFRGELLVYGHQTYEKPHRLRLLLDEKPVRDLPAPPGAGEALKNAFGRVPFSFTHRFATAGSHLVSVVLEADAPPEARGGRPVRDRVPGDNRQDLSVEVLAALPVLIVDGESSAAAPPRLRADFLAAALAPKGVRPSVAPRVITVREFSNASLSAEPRPRVVVLHDVARLSLAQAEAVGGFLGDGGGVLVTLGERAEAASYNEQLYRGGDGWLPGQLERIEGDETNVAQAVRPDPTSLSHPALDLFAKMTAGGLAEARFPRWWRLVTPGQHSNAVLAGMLQGAAARVPFFVERAYKAGRAMMCAVPLDNTWGTNLVSDEVPAFLPLVHELVYYLAGARSADFNLRAGQPIRLRLGQAEAVGAFRLRPAVGEELPLTDRAGEAGAYRAEMVSLSKGALLVYDGAREAGVYKLSPPAGPPWWYVVPPDPREADLTAAAPAERERMGKLLGVRYAESADELLGAWGSGTRRQELWLWLLLLVVGLLCAEVWVTRRLVRGR